MMYNSIDEVKIKNSEENIKTKWIIDTLHSEIGFKVKHLMISNIRGVFNEFEANIIATGEEFVTAEIEFCYESKI